MDLLDAFWNEAAVHHPEEAWATCEKTKEGILAFQSHRSSEEELRRLGREVRQMMLWGVDFQARVDRSKPDLANGYPRMVEWESVYSRQAKRTCRLWKTWDVGLREVIESTARFVEGSGELDGGLFDQWQAMLGQTSVLWGQLLGAPIFWVEEEAQEDEPIDEDDRWWEVPAEDPWI
ncbi:hypothetical protein DFH28DRAFT_880641 [Melampsora americana]|nr:hypothetical protein DFH28DRAFT_880641 [Melampsora americana]